MKRILSTLLILSLTLLCGIPALAEDTTPKRELLTSGDWVYYLLEDGGAELYQYTGPAGDIVIPNDLDGHPITAVRENPFQLLYDDFTVTVSQDHPYLATIDGVLFGKTDRSLICYPRSLTAVSYEIPEGIRRIGDYAFCDCSDLTAVTIPDSVTSIGDFAFAFCFDLTSVTIPNSVMSIGKDAFHSCGGLTSVTILDGVTSIGDYAFSGCSGLTSVMIPNSVTGIGYAAFDERDSLTLSVIAGSYAEQYCIQNNLRYTVIAPDLQDAPTD